MSGLLGKIVAITVVLAGGTATVLFLLPKREAIAAASQGTPLEREALVNEKRKKDQLAVLASVKGLLNRDRGEALLEEEGAESIEMSLDSVEDEAIDLHQVLADDPGSFEKEVLKFAQGESDLEQEVMWRIIGNWVYFRFDLSPFDAGTHELLQGGDETILMSFVDEQGTAVVPASGSVRIPTSSLYLRKGEGRTMGWGFSGKLPLGEVKEAEVTSSQIGQEFSPVLTEHLKRLKQMRAASSPPAAAALPGG
jgi:hypothetical protein